MPFTCVEIGNYCKDQDIETCGIQLNYDQDKLCTLALYRSPLGKFDNFLSNLDSVLQKLFFLLKFTLLLFAVILILTTLMRTATKRNTLIAFYIPLIFVV